MATAALTLVPRGAAPRPLPDRRLERRLRAIAEEVTRPSTQRTVSSPRASLQGPWRTDRRLDAGGTGPRAIQTYDGVGFQLVTEAGAPSQEVFHPLTATPQPGVALYLGFDRAFAPGRHRLTFEACTPGPRPAPLRAAWEYWAGPAERWRRLSVLDDGTAGLTGSGAVTFEAPPGIRPTAVGVFEGSHHAPLYWLRYRLEHIGAGYAVVPQLKAVRLGPAGASAEAALAPAVVRNRSGVVRAAEVEILATRAVGARVRRARALPIHPADLELARPKAAGEAVRAIPIPGAVTVVVVPEATGVKPMPSPETLAAVREWLGGHPLLAAELYVAAPRYRKVEIHARVIARRGFRPVDVQRSLITRLLEYFHPLEGGASRAGWVFGGAIRSSETCRQILATPGITGLDAFTTYVDGEPVEPGADVGLRPDEIVYSERHLVSVT